MGRSEVQPGADGTVRTVFGAYAPELDVTAWDPARRFAYRSGKAPDGRFIAYEFLIEGRAGSSTVLRTVTSGPRPARLGNLAQPDARLTLINLTLTKETWRHAMNTVQSADGTAISYTRAGQGPPLILVDGALCSRSLGPMPKLAAQLTPHFTVYTYDRRGRGASGDTAPYAPDREVDDIEALTAVAGRAAMAGRTATAGETVFVHGTSSGAALALEAAKRIPAIAKLAVYEPPFIVDGTRSPIPDGYLATLTRLIADGRRGDAVKMFMRFVGTPAIFTAVMPFTPVWPKLKAVAPTLPYDIAIVQDHQRGRPFAAEEWAAVKIPALVAVGGKSPAWMTNATRAVADALPDARHQTVPGQNHMVKPQAIAPVLTEFFLNDH